MKKIVLATLFAAVLAVLSGCHIDVDTDYHHNHLNTLHVYNESRWTVHDFFVEADDGWREYPDNNHISRGDKGKIYDLPDDYYRIYILLGDFDWYCSGLTDIYCDTNYYIKNHHDDDYFEDRAAVTVFNENSSLPDSIVLVDDSGNEFVLVKQ